MTQHRRWGLLRDEPDYLAVARQVNRIDLYRQAAEMTATPVPPSPMRSSTLCDGVRVGWQRAGSVRGIVCHRPFFLIGECIMAQQGSVTLVGAGRATRTC